MRSHVLGQGPRRQFLPNFQKIGQIPNYEIVVQEVLTVLASAAHENDIKTDRYAVSQICPLSERIPAGFRNLVLQDVPPGMNGENEKNYTTWNERSLGMHLRSYMQENFPKAYRTRIAVLPSGGELGWHIDTNTSVSCRIHIPITNLGSKFQVKRRSAIDTGNFEIGGLYFTNTGYSHRVFNPTAEDRVSVIFGIDHEHIAHLLPVFDGPVTGDLALNTDL